MKLKLIFCIGVAAITAGSCEYDQEEPDQVVPPTTDTTTTDTTTTDTTVANSPDTTYNDLIKPVITLECAKAGCHTIGSGFGDFTTYAGIKVVVDNGKFEDRVVKGINGPMPQGGYSDKPTNKNKPLLEAWLTKGAPEN